MIATPRATEIKTLIRGFAVSKYSFIKNIISKSYKNGK